ncbi:hypothetical protein MFLAVUS_005957 [Mucor flavus]|uniref:Uncharacterized protein n=1 Tax=Mucor flavus TaxID=439312 RepID=A0ABP9Z054_9FUNG
MPSLSKLFKSAKQSFSSKQRKSSSDSGGGKSVRFSISNESVYYTHSSVEYDRRSSIVFDPYLHEADSLKSFNSSEHDDDSVTFDEEVLRNTKVNKKQGHYSIAALVAYRANI